MTMGSDINAAYVLRIKYRRGLLKTPSIMY
jgi:hypothetical protein